MRERINTSAVVGDVATLIVALICAVVAMHTLSDPSISFGTIATAVISIVGGLAAITACAVMLMAAGFGYRSVKR